LRRPGLPPLGYRFYVHNPDLVPLWIGVENCDGNGTGSGYRFEEPFEEKFFGQSSCGRITVAKDSSSLDKKAKVTVRDKNEIDTYATLLIEPNDGGTKTVSLEDIPDTEFTIRIMDTTPPPPSEIGSVMFTIANDVVGVAYAPLTVKVRNSPVDGQGEKAVVGPDNSDSMLWYGNTVGTEVRISKDLTYSLHDVRVIVQRLGAPSPPLSNVVLAKGHAHEDILLCTVPAWAGDEMIEVACEYVPWEVGSTVFNYHGFWASVALRNNPMDSNGWANLSDGGSEAFAIYSNTYGTAIRIRTSISSHLDDRRFLAYDRSDGSVPLDVRLPVGIGSSGQDVGAIQAASGDRSIDLVLGGSHSDAEMGVTPLRLDIAEVIQGQNIFVQNVPDDTSKYMLNREVNTHGRTGQTQYTRIGFNGSLPSDSPNALRIVIKRHITGETVHDGTIKPGDFETNLTLYEVPASEVYPWYDVELEWVAAPVTQGLSYNFVVDNPDGTGTQAYVGTGSVEPLYLNMEDGASTVGVIPVDVVFGLVVQVTIRPGAAGARVELRDISDNLLIHTNLTGWPGLTVSWEFPNISQYGKQEVVVKFMDLLA